METRICPILAIASSNPEEPCREGKCAFYVSVPTLSVPVCTLVHGLTNIAWAVKRHTDTVAPKEK